MPITFPCPACGQKTQAPEELIGKRARCPLCAQVIKVPDAGAPAQPAAPPSQPAADDSSPARQPCPACGELIRDGAVRCRYCGEELIGAGRRNDYYVVQGTSTAATTSLACGILGLVIWCVPCLNILALPLCITALVTGLVSSKDVSNRGNAIAGIVLGAIGLVGGIVLIFFIVVARMGQM